jgi:hypothetical protein
VDCKAGYYCPSGTRYEKQHPCPRGYYSTNTGLTHSKQCWHCGIGKYCPSFGMGAALPCPAGWYNNIVTDATECSVCPSGYYCEAPDFTDATLAKKINPQLCPVGTYSSTGKTKQDCTTTSDTDCCLYCPIGSYCPYSGTTEAQMIA